MFPNNFTVYNQTKLIIWMEKYKYLIQMSLTEQQIIYLFNTGKIVVGGQSCYSEYNILTIFLGGCRGFRNPNTQYG